MNRRDIVDILVTAVNSANTTMEEFIESLSYAAPTAAPLKKELTEVAAILATLANRGINASRAGVIIRQVFFAASRKLREFGIDVQNTTFLDALETLRDDVRFTYDDIVDTLETRAGFAVNLFLPLIEEMREMQAGLEASGGAAEEMARKMDDSVFGALRRVKSASQDFTQVLVRDTLGTRNTIDSLNSLAMTINATARQMDKIVAVVVGGIASWVAYRIVVSTAAKVFANVIVQLGGLFRIIPGVTEKTVGFARATQQARGAASGFATVLGAQLKSNILGIVGLLAGLGTALYTYFALAKDEADDLADRLANVYENVNRVSSQFNADIVKLLRDTTGDDAGLQRGLLRTLSTTEGQRAGVVDQIEQELPSLLDQFTREFFRNPNLLGGQASAFAGQFTLPAGDQRRLERLPGGELDPRQFFEEVARGLPQAVRDITPEALEELLSNRDIQGLQNFANSLNSIAEQGDDVNKVAGRILDIANTLSELPNTVFAQQALQQLQGGQSQLARFTLGLYDPSGAAETPRSIQAGEVLTREIEAFTNTLRGLLQLRHTQDPALQAVFSGEGARAQLEQEIFNAAKAFGPDAERVTQLLESAILSELQDKLDKEDTTVLEAYNKFKGEFDKYSEIVI